MFDFSTADRPIETIQPFSLYKWSKNYTSLQHRLFEEDLTLIREKQIIDFVDLNGFKSVCVIKDTDIFKTGFTAAQVVCPEQAEILIVTDQNFSRRPCPAIIHEIQKLLAQCPTLYLCLNRHYINIDNSYHDTSLPDDWQRAVTEWLKNMLPNTLVLDLSFRWDDRGDFWSWSIPDRHYYISRI